MSVLLWVALPAAAEAPLLRWVLSDNPPMFVLPQGRAPRSAAELGHNELDGMLRLVVERLPQYRHEFVVAETARLEVLVRAGEPVCSNLLLRTPERLQWLYFTHGHLPLQSRRLQLVTRPELLPRLAHLGRPPDLVALLHSPDLRGLIQRDRSYGPHVDALLDQHGQALRDSAIGRHGANLLRMLQVGRMDYTLEYGATVEEFNRAQGARLQLLPLDASPSTARATWACARNAAGRERIEAIDAALRGLAAERPRERWLRSWLGRLPGAQERRRLNHYFDERARAGPQIE